MNIHSTRDHPEKEVGFVAITTGTVIEKATVVVNKNFLASDVSSANLKIKAVALRKSPHLKKLAKGIGEGGRTSFKFFPHENK